jgi:hypothetical protein
VVLNWESLAQISKEKLPTLSFTSTFSISSILASLIASILCIASINALYSASLVFRAIVLWSFDLTEMQHPPDDILYLDQDLADTGSPAGSLPKRPAK